MAPLHLPPSIQMNSHLSYESRWNLAYQLPAVPSGEGTVTGDHTAERDRTAVRCRMRRQSASNWMHLLFLALHFAPKVSIQAVADRQSM